MGRLALIDIGTFTCRLALLNIEDGSIYQFKKKSRVCDLGEGVDKTHHLSQAAIKRVLLCVQDYLVRIQSEGIERIVCTLTSAARDAENSAVLTGALEALGLNPQVIAGSTEAALTFWGIAHDLPDKTILAADSGGGSTELIVGRYNSRLRRPEIFWSHSIDLGCRRISDKAFSEGLPPTADALAYATQLCKEGFHAAFKEAQAVLGEDGVPAILSAADCAPSATQTSVLEQLVVCGGTATTLSAMNMNLSAYDERMVHHSCVSAQELVALKELLARKSVEEISELPGIQKKRAPVILGGTVVLSELLHVFGFDAMMVSETDLLHGLAFACEHTDDFLSGTI